MKLELMLDRCQQMQFLLNIKKCILYTLFGVSLVHIVCKEGLLVVLEKLSLIVNLLVLKNVFSLCSTLEHRAYYNSFTKGYLKLTF
jgi:hypothetical protein